MSIHISRELEESVACYTDAGEWKHSWHWDRDRAKVWGQITLKGAYQMLADLNCEGCKHEEIAASVRRIEARYALADTLRAMIEKANITEIADTHQDDCTCEFCQQAGYVEARRDATQTHE